MAESTEKVTSTDKGTGKTVERREVTKKGGGLRWILYAAVVIIVILAAAYLTIGVVISEAPPAASYPYTTTYQVFLPASQVVTIGNSEIIAIPTRRSGHPLHQQTAERDERRRDEDHPGAGGP